ETPRSIVVDGSTFEADEFTGRFLVVSGGSTMTTPVAKLISGGLPNLEAEISGSSQWTAANSLHIEVTTGLMGGSTLTSGRTTFGFGGSVLVSDANSNWTITESLEGGRIEIKNSGKVTAPTVQSSHLYVVGSGSRLEFGERFAGDGGLAVWEGATAEGKDLVLRNAGGSSRDKSTVKVTGECNVGVGGI